MYYHSIARLMSFSKKNQKYNRKMDKSTESNKISGYIIHKAKDRSHLAHP